MKWQAGYGLNAIRGVSQRSPRSASCGSRSIARVHERVEDAEAALEHAGRALGAERGEPRGEQRAVRRPARDGSASSRSRRRGTRRAPTPCCPRSRARSRRRVGRETAEPRGRGRRAEDPADRRRVEAARVEGAGRRHADSRHDLVAGDDGGEQLPAARAARLRDRERGRHDDRRDVRDRVRVRVVEVEAVAEHRVREGGVRGGQRGVEADHRRLGLAAELRHRRAALGGDAEAVRGEAAADDVEHVQLRRLDDRRRDVVQVELERPGGEPLGGRHTVHSSSVPGKAPLRLRRASACRP